MPGIVARRSRSSASRSAILVPGLGFRGQRLARGSARDRPGPGIGQLVAGFEVPSDLSTDDRDLVQRLVNERLLPPVLELGADGCACQRIGFLDAQVKLDALLGHRVLEHLRRLELHPVVTPAHDPAVAGVAVRDDGGLRVVGVLPGASVLVRLAPSRVDLPPRPPERILERLRVAATLGGVGGLRPVGELGVRGHRTPFARQAS